MNERRIAELERRIAMLEKQLVKMPSRFAIGGGGGGESVYRVDTVTSLPNLAASLDGAIGYTQDTDTHYLRQDEEWVAMAALGSAAPQDVLDASGTAAVGTATTAARSDHKHKSDHIKDTSGKGYFYTGSEWLLFTHLQSS